MISDNMKAMLNGVDAYELIKYLRNERHYAISAWTIIDVKYQAEQIGFGEVSDDFCIEVLNMVDAKHDANIGINWDIIELWIRQLYTEEEEDD